MLTTHLHQVPKFTKEYSPYVPPTQVIGCAILLFYFSHWSLDGGPRLVDKYHVASRCYGRFLDRCHVTWVQVMGPVKSACVMSSRPPLWAKIAPLLCYQSSRDCGRHCVRPFTYSHVKVPTFLAHHFTSTPPLHNPSTTISTSSKT